MVNVNAPFGLRALRKLSGGYPATNAYTIASAYNTNIFQGDPVKSSGTGNGIIIGTAGGSILGVFNGVTYIDVDGVPQYRPYWPADAVATKIEALVYDEPDIIFLAQANGAPAAANVHLLADLVSGTGDTKTGLSGWEIGAFAGSEAQVRLMKLHDVVGNAYGANAVMEILIGEHELRANLVEV